MNALAAPTDLPPLPGGLVEHGQRRRDWAFHPLTGALELALAEAADDAQDTPGAVTAVLSQALARLAGEPPRPHRVAALCLADRQFLMRQLAQHLDEDPGAPTPQWLSSRCPACGAHFDFALDLAALPVTEAGPGYPWAELAGEDGVTRRFRLPVGADLSELARQPDDTVEAWLLQRLAESPDTLPLGEPAQIGAWAARVEAALDAIAPALVLQVQAACPECGTAHAVDLDPYGALRHRPDTLLLQVHRLAWHYHWSEAEILALPRPRRLRYLQLIDQARGLSA